MKHDHPRPAADLPPYIILQPAVPGEGIYDRAERRAGKSHYTYADYLAEGREWALSKGVPAIAVAHHARCYAAIHCPPGKMRGGA